MNGSKLAIREYAVVTGAYWAFTITDGALRMLVLLHFHTLGFSPLALAFLFLLYEFVGIVTNLFGGWLGARYGLRITLFMGLAIQSVALVALSAVQPSWALSLSVMYVMGCQALSGVAKDLTKMSSKSAVKLLVKPDSHDARENSLFKWVAFLTGSKNALKGLGFFAGGLGLATIGFAGSLWLMAALLTVILFFCTRYLTSDLGRAKTKPSLTGLLSKTQRINDLSLARLFLFASRDVWFVVALPVFLHAQLGWGFAQIGAYLALWVIGYGAIQTVAPKLIRQPVDARAASTWGAVLLVVCLAMVTAIYFDVYPAISIVSGLAIFGVVFAVNSSLHSYLILAYTNNDEVALDVGFYYMANAAGRLLGTLLSGLMYMAGGLLLCLLTSAILVTLAVVISHRLPTEVSVQSA